MNKDEKIINLAIENDKLRQELQEIKDNLEKYKAPSSKSGSIMIDEAMK